MENNVTAIIRVKVKPETKHGYKEIAKIISEFREVEAVYLMSGEYDFVVMANGENLRQVGRFVSEKLSIITGVLSVSSAFVMERYKHGGEILSVVEENDDRSLFNV
ncbi:MAG: Lrp/AsnC family transcriptional regulator [Oscillospiraceae bacterium]|nr:Lrp/AsnC family transcriptional regulator [Oscillospiraceae bacterium]